MPGFNDAKLYPRRKGRVRKEMAVVKGPMRKWEVWAYDGVIMHFSAENEGAAEKIWKSIVPLTHHGACALYEAGYAGG